MKNAQNLYKYNAFVITNPTEAQKRIFIDTARAVHQEIDNSAIFAKFKLEENEQGSQIIYCAKNVDFYNQLCAKIFRFGQVMHNALEKNPELKKELDSIDIKWLDLKGNPHPINQTPLCQFIKPDPRISLFFNLEILHITCNTENFDITSKNQDNKLVFYLVLKNLNAPLSDEEIEFAKFNIITTGLKLTKKSCCNYNMEYLAPTGQVTKKENFKSISKSPKPDKSSYYQQKIESTKLPHDIETILANSKTRNEEYRTIFIKRARFTNEIYYMYDTIEEKLARRNVAPDEQYDIIIEPITIDDCNYLAVNIKGPVCQQICINHSSIIDSSLQHNYSCMNHTYPLYKIDLKGRFTPANYIPLAMFNIGKTQKLALLNTIDELQKATTNDYKIKLQREKDNFIAYMVVNPETRSLLNTKYLHLREVKSNLVKVLDKSHCKHKIIDDNGLITSSYRGDGQTIIKNIESAQNIQNSR